MWIAEAHLKDVFSHKGTSITFDRARPIALFIGPNSSGKTPTAYAFELGLTSEVLDLRGTGLTTARMIRNLPLPAATSGSVRLIVQAAPDSKPVEIRRRVTSRGIETSINGTRATKGVFDLVARIKGDADPAAVFRVLCNVAGFFELGTDPQETARRQKSLLVGLIDQSIPEGTFTAWPAAFGALPTTFGAVEEAFGLASARLTALNRELEGIRVEPLVGEPMTDALIAQIVERIATVRGEKEQRLLAQGDAAGRRATLTQALLGQREHLAGLRKRLDGLGPRPTASVLGLAERQANAVRVVDIEKEIAARQRALDTANGRRSELTLSLGTKRRRRDEVRDQQKQRGSIEAANDALSGAHAAVGHLMAEEGAWQVRYASVAMLRNKRALLEEHAALLSTCAEHCICRRPLTSVERDFATEHYGTVLLALDNQIHAQSAAMGVAPVGELDTARATVRECERSVEAIQRGDVLLSGLEAEISSAEAALAALPTADPRIDTLKAERVALVQAETLAEEVEGYDTLAIEIEQQEDVVARTETELAALPQEDPEIAVLAERLTVGEQRLTEARARYAAQQRNDAAQIQAGRLGAEAEALGALRDQLGPKGVRERLLVQRLGDLTSRVNEILAYFGLKLEFKSDPWEVLLNGAQLPALFGETEAMRCGVAFQIALAEITGARIAIIDRFGNFDGANRAAFFKVVNVALERGWLEQLIVFSTCVGEVPRVAPGPNVALYSVSRPEGGSTAIARIA